LKPDCGGDQRRSIEGKETRSDETSRLRRCIRDLVALSGLSVAWSGHEPLQIAESLADVLLHTLCLDFAYIRLNGQTEGVALEAGCTDQGPDTAERIQLIGRALAPWLQSNITGPAAVASVADPFGSGTVRVVLSPIGFEGACGVLVAGSRHVDFPTDAERVLLSVGANQAAIILQHRQAEEALRESEAQLRLALDAARLGTWEWDIEADRVVIGGHYEAAMGTAPEDLAGFLALVHPDDREQVRGSIWRTVEEGADYQPEFRIARPDGEVRWIKATAQILRDSENRSGRMIGGVQNITERKQAEVAQRQLAAIVESSNDAIISKTLDGIITSWNAGAEHIFGYTADEVLGRPINLLIPPDRQDEEPQILERLKRGEHIAHFDTVRVRKDGYPVDISLTISPIRDERGTIIGASKIARDITERRQAQAEREALLAEEHRLREAAEAANRAKDEFMAVVSHELRSPLNAMLGWARVLQSQQPLDPATLSQAIDVINRNIDLQRQLIDDLLDTARIVSGKLKLEVEPLNLVIVIEEALDVVRPAAEAKGVKLYAVIAASEEQVTGDPARLQQVIWNLLSNAVKFTPKGGRIELRLERADPYVRITVSDTGCGIAPELLPYLFDRFRQANSSSTRRHGGLGIGLALVKHLVELHGGEVRAESPGEGQGATFTVDLPIRAVRFPTPVHEPSPRAEGEVKTAAAVTLADLPSLAGVRALVVDDQDEARELLATVLENRGAEVAAVGSGREALAWLKARLESEPPDVFICDIGMPEEDGYTIIRNVRALETSRGIHLRRRIPAIALTAFAQPEDRIRTLQAGFQIHVAKPVEPPELIVVIDTLVRGGGHERVAGLRP
jgi:PAS domain S-box-containing protein